MSLLSFNIHLFYLFLRIFLRIQYPHVRSTKDPMDDFKKREMMLSNILEKISPQYEEIGNLLSHVPEPKKRQILGGIISRAF